MADQREDAPIIHELLSSEETRCCIVGGGPAGVMLSLMLARKGVPTILLEAHKDFNREFRGDSLHPSTLELIDQLGLMDGLLQLPHSKLSKMSAVTPTGPVEMADLSHLKTRYPYVMMMPQAIFLDYITKEAQRFPNFKLILNANVSDLIEDNGIVHGVRYRGSNGWHEIRALLTVGADGRFSRLRKLAGFEPIKTSPPMDILWFRLPRHPNEEGGGMGRFGHGHILVEIDRNDYWQMGYVIPKGGYHELHEAGIAVLQAEIVKMAPELADWVQEIKDWKDISLLSVEANRLPRWYRPGLLLIGDAAHVMSPVGGNGINYAIQDAIAAANILIEPLKTGSLRTEHLAVVQRKREWPTRIIQAIVTVMQKRIIAGALDPNKSFALPAFLSWPVFRNLPARIMGFGIGREQLKD